MMRILTIAVVVVVVASGCAKGTDDERRPAGIPSTMDQWERFDYASSAIPAAALAPLPLVELQRIRGIIFGKHGRVFQDSTLERWLASRPWYRPDSSFTNARLTQEERENLELVREAEAKKHPQIESGDMRFYDNRVITTAMLGDHSPQDWEVLEAEVLANHGFVFETELDMENRDLQPDDLQRYFDERYWYQRRPEFRATELSAIERQNLDTIAVAVTRQNKRTLSPGMMNLFQSTPLTEQMLSHLTLADMRLLRNEIYARRGRPFQTAWLAAVFRQYPWYIPRSDYSDADLSPVERANIALITQREQQLHESLSTKLLDSDDVQGLRSEDARRLRNEIYARHGRRFRDPALQRYFASFAWYKPNDSFRENQLNATERKNADLISQYEQGRFTEG
jgi:YARHG domain-containing protein